MDEQMQDDPLEPTYNSSVPIQDVALKIYQKQWSGRGPEISTRMVQHDDGDDDEYLFCQLQKS